MYWKEMKNFVFYDVGYCWKEVVEDLSEKGEGCNSVAELF